MFSAYVEKAMHRAVYELSEDGTFFGTIPGFDGVWANGSTLEECRNELLSTLEGWLSLGLWLNEETLPKLGRFDLVPRKLVAASKTENEPASSARTRKGVLDGSAGKVRSPAGL